MQHLLFHTSDPNRLELILTNKMDLWRSDKRIALSDLSICYRQKNIKISWPSNKFKISGTAWDEKISIIQGYFEDIIKRYDTLTGKSPIQIYINKIQNRNTFKIQNYYPELLTYTISTQKYFIRVSINRDMVYWSKLCPARDRNRKN